MLMYLQSLALSSWIFSADLFFLISIAAVLCRCLAIQIVVLQDPIARFTRVS